MFKSCSFIDNVPVSVTYYGVFNLYLLCRFRILFVSFSQVPSDRYRTTLLFLWNVLPFSVRRLRKFAPCHDDRHPGLSRGPT